jgi:hypothetical protein
MVVVHPLLFLPLLKAVEPMELQLGTQHQEVLDIGAPAASALQVVSALLPWEVYIAAEVLLLEADVEPQ